MDCRDRKARQHRVTAKTLVLAGDRQRLKPWQRPASESGYPVSCNGVRWQRGGRNR